MITVSMIFCDNLNDCELLKEGHGVRQWVTAFLTRLIF